MSLRSFSFVTLLLAVAFLAVPRGQAQNTSQSQAVIDGTVVDSAGGTLPGTTLALERDTAVRATTVSGTGGRFRFAAVPAGEYRVRATLASFKTIITPVTVPATGTLVLRITMEVGSPGEEVMVAAGAPVVDTKKTTTQWNLEGGSITDLAAGRGGRAIGTPAANGAAPVPPPPSSSPAYTNFDSFEQLRRDPWPRPTEPHTEAYAHVAANPFRLTADEPLSTFAADVDTASYTNVRRFLKDGALPPADAVRVEEFVNYFQYHYPVPEDGRPVSITTEVGAAPWARAHRLVLVGLRAKPIEQRAVGGRNIVLLLDVSGSMHSADKLPLVKTGLRMFVDTLRDDDRVAIVVYAGASGLVLPSTPARRRDAIHDAIENL